MCVCARAIITERNQKLLPLLVFFALPDSRCFQPARTRRRARFRFHSSKRNSCEAEQRISHTLNFRLLLHVSVIRFPVFSQKQRR